MTETIRLPAPLKGLLEGRDPALPDGEFPPAFAQDLENLRVGKGLLETRLGMSAYAPAAVGSGAARLFQTHYLSNGNRYRIFIRGNTTAAVLYYILQGTHNSWQSPSSGHTGLGDSAGSPVPYGVTLKDVFYFVDRAGALRKFDHAANTVASVTGPTAPVVAAQVQPTTYAILDGDVNTWTQSDSTNFPRSTAGTYPKSPLNDRMVRLRVNSSGALDDTISENTANEEVASHWIAFYWQADNVNQMLTFEVGTVEAAEFSVILDAPQANKTYPVFLGIGAVGRISFKRFRVNAQPVNVRDHFVSKLILPGRLDGRYRWRYTHYNSTTTAESEPSPISNSGNFSDLSKVPVSWQTTASQGVADAFKKAALLSFSSDDAGSTTDKIRIYRNGGVPSLTKDSQNQDVWVRIATIADVETTFSASPSAGATTFTITSVTNVVVDDWLVLDRGCPTVQEWVQVGSISGTTITIKNSGTLKNAHSNKTTSTTLNGAAAKGATSFVATSASGIAANDWLVLDRNNSVEEFVKVGSVAGSTVNLHADTPTLLNAHADGATVKAVNHVQVAYLDNNGDESLDSTLRLEAERDDPPSGGHWLDKAPDGRLWIFRFSGKPLGVAVSNLPTADRTKDYEVFPDGVDPLTRQSLTQGFRFNITTDASGDEIMWGGFFNRVPIVFTRKALYQINAYSQSDYGADAVQKVADVGCINGFTVARINGLILWVGPGPTVYTWDGIGPPNDIGFERITDTLKNAPSAQHGSWFAYGHQDARGIYYRLRMVPSGQTTPTTRLDFNLILDAWEPQVYYDSGGTALAFGPGSVLDGVNDANELYESGASDGKIYPMETGSTDNSQVIRTTFLSKRVRLPGTCLVREVRLRLAAVTDTVSLQVKTGGSEYGDVTNTYSGLSVSGSNDLEVRQPVGFNQLGRWIEIQITSSASNRPAIRDIEIIYQKVRGERISA